MTKVARPADPALERLLASHGDVVVIEGVGRDELTIDQEGWRREIAFGDARCEVAGLVELMDNNPLVCADRASVPGPVATLALIALGPLAIAGLLLEQPVIQVAGAVRDPTVDAFLSREGWSAGAAVSYGDEDLKGVIAANVVALIRTPGDWREVDELYRERYAHSFYVRESSEGAWDSALVAGKPWACYRLSRSPGEEASLLTVQVMADKDGKCGAAQAVHMMNLMCGFEECSGL